MEWLARLSPDQIPEWYGKQVALCFRALIRWAVEKPSLMVQDGQVWAVFENGHVLVFDQVVVHGNTFWVSCWSPDCERPLAFDARWFWPDNLIEALPKCE